MTDTDLDRGRRYLAPVGRLKLAGQPYDTHLSVYQWQPTAGEWLTGPALCGHSTSQGPLPQGTEVTCTGCLDYQDKYKRMLAPGYQPEQDDPAALRKRLERAHIEAAEMSGLIGDLRREVADLREVEGLLSQWAPQLMASYPVLFRKLDQLLTLSQPKEVGR